MTTAKIAEFCTLPVLEERGGQNIRGAKLLACCQNTVKEYDLAGFFGWVQIKGYFLCINWCKSVLAQAYTHAITAEKVTFRLHPFFMLRPWQKRRIFQTVLSPLTSEPGCHASTTAMYGNLGHTIK